VSSLALRPAQECRFDVVALGEIMLRLDPGVGRIRNAREFRVWEGGGEYNVARGLRRCFGRRTAVVTAFADNEVGRLLEDFVLQGGVDTSLIRWVASDGIGRTVRNGLNFTERGFGVRGALGVSDRGNTAASQLRPGDVDWEHLFGTLGVRWFHTGGIFAALSETTPDVVAEAVGLADQPELEIRKALLHACNQRVDAVMAVARHQRIDVFRIARPVLRQDFKPALRRPLVPQIDIGLGDRADLGNRVDVGHGALLRLRRMDRLTDH